MCEFSEVFFEDINDFPPECEAKFTVNLVPDTSPMSMTPYKMFDFKKATGRFA